MMLRSITCAALGAGLATIATSQDAALPAGPFSSRYQIEVELLHAQRLLEGSETITYTHAEAAPIEELVLHLYPNAFVGDRSVFFAERQRDSGLDLLQGWEAAELSEQLGYCRITALRTGAVTPAHQIDGSLLTVRLAQPLVEGASVDLEIEFQTKLPRTVARMGYFGEHYDVMQWFPKLAARVDGQWNREPFHGSTEFFANFASYDVTIVTPEAFEVGATGELVGEPVPVAAADGRGPRLSRRFVARSIHDFAWCADPHFIEFEDSLTYPSGHEVKIRYLCQPFGQEKANLVLRMTRRCLSLYGDWFRPYPYPVLTIDGLPYGLMGGMEYPMLFTISQRFPNHLGLLTDLTEEPAGVTAHEFGHQYWYGILASNEFTEAWLDEGVNTYVTTKVEEEFWGIDHGRMLQAMEWGEVLKPFLNDGFDLRVAGRTFGVIDLIGYEQTPFSNPRLGALPEPTLLGFGIPTGRIPGFHVERFTGRRARYATVLDTSPIRSVSYRMHPRAYSNIAYSKTAVGLATLERLYGWEAMRDALATYVERSWFAHPTGEQFLSVLLERLPASTLPGAAELPLERILAQIFDTTQRLDYAVARVETNRVTEPRGYAIGPQAGDPVEFTAPGAADEGFFNRVLVENRGGMELPVEIQLAYQDGTVERRRWDGLGRFHWVETISAAPLATAAVDPAGKLLLDLDHNNNGKTVERNAVTVNRYRAALLYWSEALLALLQVATGP